MKELKEVVVESGIRSDLEGSLDSAIEFLIELKMKYIEFTDLRLEIESLSYEYCSSASVDLYGKRLETDEEEEEREAQEQSYAKRIKDSELAKLAELKAKYEGKV